MNNKTNHASPMPHNSGAHATDDLPVYMQVEDRKRRRRRQELILDILCIYLPLAGFTAFAIWSAIGLAGY